MFSIHSHTRYLVLLVGVLTVLYGLYGLARRRPLDRTGLVLLRVFTGIIDLQILFGIINVITRPFFPALIGHITMMIAAAAVAHLGAVRLKKLPEAERGFGLLTMSAAIPLLLMIGGILAIHRAII